MGLGCLIGLHDGWSGWERIDDGPSFGMRHPHWVRECLSCGELERRQRPPFSLCGPEDDDHDWAGGALVPLEREAVSRNGEKYRQRFKRCRRCPAEKVFWGLGGFDWTSGGSDGFGERRR
jgi:hypothetical protein